MVLLDLAIVSKWDCQHAEPDGEISWCGIVKRAKQAGVSIDQLDFVTGESFLPLMGSRGQLCCGYPNNESFGRRRCMGAIASPIGVGHWIKFAKKGERIIYVEKQDEFASVFGPSGLDWFIRSLEAQGFNLDGTGWKEQKNMRRRTKVR